MTPTDTAANKRYIFGCSIEHFAQSGISKCPRSMKTTNLKNLLRYKLGRSALFADRMKAPKNLMGVSQIFRMRNPFEIFKTVVGFIAIFMIAFMTWWTWAYKSFKNKIVDHPTCSLAILSESHAQISLFSRLGIEYISKLKSITEFEGPDSSKIAYFINALIVLDWFPYFVHFVSLDRERRKDACTATHKALAAESLNINYEYKHALCVA